MAESVNHLSPAAAVTRHGSDEVTEILPARASASSDRKLSPALTTSTGRVVSSSLHAADPAIRARQRRAENNLFIANQISVTALINAAKALLLHPATDFRLKIKPHGIPCGFYPMQQTSFAFAFLDPVQMLTHPFAEKLTAVLQIGLPPQPAGVTLPFSG